MLDAKRKAMEPVGIETELRARIRAMESLGLVLRQLKRPCGLLGVMSFEHLTDEKLDA